MHKTTAIAASVALHAVLVAFGVWQDAQGSLSFTDIDYSVFTAAAAFVRNQRSPFDRDTFR